MPGLQLIIGLGNPGADYTRTRHNAGFAFIDALAETTGARWVLEGKLFGMVARAEVGAQPVRLFKPMTFMNLSGKAVSAALRYWNIAPEATLIAHDDLDLPPGVARLKFDGGHGGQNGLRDIIRALGHARFQRLRLGIGHPGHRDQVLGWVLGRPSSDDAILMARAIDAAIEVLPLAVTGHLEEAMKRLHTVKT